MSGFKFPFQDKAVNFTGVNASTAEPLHLGGCFRRQAANTEKLWGVSSPEQPAWKGYPDPKQHIPNTAIIHLTW